jgi:hypothetical protein
MQDETSRSGVHRGRFRPSYSWWGFSCQGDLSRLTGPSSPARRIVLRARCIPLLRCAPVAVVPCPRSLIAVLGFCRSPFANPIFE